MGGLVKLRSFIRPEEGNGGVGGQQGGGGAVRWVVWRGGSRVGGEVRWVVWRGGSEVWGEGGAALLPYQTCATARGTTFRVRAGRRGQEKKTFRGVGLIRGVAEVA